MLLWLDSLELLWLLELYWLELLSSTGTAIATDTFGVTRGAFCWVLGLGRAVLKCKMPGSLWNPL